MLANVKLKTQFVNFMTISFPFLISSIERSISQVAKIVLEHGYQSACLCLQVFMDEKLNSYLLFNGNDLLMLGKVMNQGKLTIYIYLTVVHLPCSSGEVVVYDLSGTALCSLKVYSFLLV